MTHPLALSPRVIQAEIRFLIDKALFAMWDRGASSLHKDLGPRAEDWKRLHDTKGLSADQVKVAKTFLGLEDQRRLEVLLGESD